MLLLVENITGTGAFFNGTNEFSAEKAVFKRAILTKKAHLTAKKVPLDWGLSGTFEYSREFYCSSIHLIQRLLKVVPAAACVGVGELVA